MDEFELIDKIFKPLSPKGAPAFGLENDTAIYSPPPGFDLVITKDAFITGVHYPNNLPARFAARRLLRANLSDLAASGAKPLGYLLGLMGADDLDAGWLSDFAAGLKADQEEFGISLFGGDTTSGSKTTCLSLTALGLVKKGQALTRKGAKPGDLLCVSGTIGDGYLGLKSLSDEIPENAYLESRFKIPQPRLELGQNLTSLASASIDVSDGLLADINHLLESSKAGAELFLDEVPFSVEAVEYTGKDLARKLELMAAGDDFELVFTLPPANKKKLGALYRKLDLPISVIGEIKKGAGLTLLDKDGDPVSFKTEGYRHFKGGGKP